MERWDVVVVGGGPAGLNAARVAAGLGARTLVLERAEYPRYKTCGGGLIGYSLAALPEGFAVPVRDHVSRISVTRHGRLRYTKSSATPLVDMVVRTEFDAALAKATGDAGATVRANAPVRSLEQHPDGVTVRLADGTRVAADVVVGADGSSGHTARHVGVTFDQVDLGLEVELPVPAAVARDWRGRLLIDWGPLPGSYGWVFPKGDRLTVGVIAARGRGEETRQYLRRFLGQLGLSRFEAEHDSGHLTRCRSADSPLARGRVLVAGDAAGLLEPWTREGISFALRSGALAGAAAATGDLAGYPAAVTRTLGPAMRAGRQLLAAFECRPGLFHALLATPPGWHLMARFSRGEGDFADVLRHRSVRLGLAAVTNLSRRSGG